MADKAIDKLFEEMRATAEELTAIQNDEEALQEQLRDLRKRHVTAIKHRDVLDVTLRKHIHTGMPVVQAKMVAHEEFEQSRNAASSAMSRSANASSAPSWSMTTATQAALNVQIAHTGNAIASGNNLIGGRIGLL